MSNLFRVSFILTAIVFMSFCGFSGLAEHRGRAYAQSSDEEKVKEIVLGALEGFEKDDFDMFTKDFSQGPDVRFFVWRVGGTRPELLDFETYKEEFQKRKEKRESLSMDDISLSKPEIADDKADIMVKFSRSLVSLEKDKFVRQNRAFSASLRKEGGDWKIWEWRHIPLSTKDGGAKE